MEEPMLTMKVDKRAVDTFEDMARQAAAVEAAWGTIKPEWVTKTLSTLATQSTRLFRMGFGDVEIFRDGELSLFVRTASGFVFGMIGHREGRPDTAGPDIPTAGGIKAPDMGLYCLSRRDTEDRYCASPVSRGEPTCSGHELALFAMPVPQDWSFHS